MGNKKQPRPELRLLIVSVGSLVGQNILDSLDFPTFSRRHLVFVAGTNSLEMSANNFRFDECFLVPPTSSPDYPDRMRQVLRDVQPDLVLCGRDADTAAMCKIMNEDSSLPGKLPYGAFQSVLYALDKWQSFLFCRKHDLPFAESFVVGSSADTQALREFTEKVGFPLVAKPVEGFASHGVFFVRDWNEAVTFLRRDGYMFQEYLGATDRIDQYFRFLDGPVPLFTEAPEGDHRSCHIQISPEGEIGEIFVQYADAVRGAAVSVRRIAHPELERLARSFATALVSEGGFGMLAVQFLPDRKGMQKAHEMNLRTSGTTFARLLMGQDDLGFIINALLPDRKFPVYTRPPSASDLVITKSLATYSVEEDAAATMTRSGHWRAGD